MKKRMMIMLLALGILFGLIILYKLFAYIVMQRFIAANQFPTVTVSTMKAESSEWQSKLTAVATVRATKGVNVTTELAGMIRTICFTPGSYVKKGELLVQLNIDPDTAQLEALKANTKLAKITYKRDKAQYAVHAVSKQTLDTDEQNLQSLQAQVREQIANIAKKTIRAPFDGKLGISVVNPGKYLNPGDMIVTLQTFDPIYVDFALPQQELAKIKTGIAVVVTNDAYPNQIFKGKITTINPIVDIDTRNVQVEATIGNPEHTLTPGMFSYITIPTGAPAHYLTLPQTAITFNPYGNLLYIVEDKGKDEKTGKPLLTVLQSFVVTGDTRGDQIQVLKGLEEGKTVVTSGQLKLKNGSRIAINNTVQPPNNPNPITPNER